MLFSALVEEIDSVSSCEVVVTLVREVLNFFIITTQLLK